MLGIYILHNSVNVNINFKWNEMYNNMFEFSSLETKEGLDDKCGIYNIVNNMCVSKLDKILGNDVH